ncbi:hypothetical protein OTUT144_1543 [Orientia tsutsugamushi str. UT144]|uniref:Uncharacterized protein n=1 Tax=Orientia tsutsugamushi str. UT144 TaxID=1441384 RepID=A0A0F3RJG5_ORITS|nr:hypothetical protein OTUT144_1543 [Orientia tsutsugamushi str. UT144]
MLEEQYKELDSNKAIVIDGITKGLWQEVDRKSALASY